MKMLTAEDLARPPVSIDLFSLGAGAETYDPRIRDVQKISMIHVEGVSDSQMSASVITGETGSDDDHTALVQIRCDCTDGLLNASVDGDVISFYGRDHGDYNTGILARLFREIADALESARSTEGDFTRQLNNGRTEIFFGDRAPYEEPETTAACPF